jgi:hypothetical protein
MEKEGQEFVATLRERERLKLGRIGQMRGNGRGGDGRRDQLTLQPLKSIQGCTCRGPHRLGEWLGSNFLIRALT